MKFNPEIRHRRSIRLRDYDYAQAGAYFVTICSQNRECLFGEIVEGEMQPSAAGDMIQMVWHEIPAHYPGVDVSEFVVMPNHVHGIIVITEISPNHPVGAAPRGRPCTRPMALGHPEPGQARGPAPTVRLSLPDVVQRFKTMTTKHYGDGVKHAGWPAFSDRLWQRNYWEHIVRNEDDLSKIREYIHNNPAQWELDKLHPQSKWNVGAAPRGRPCTRPMALGHPEPGQARGPAPTDNTGVA
jgi:REP element-mobilizing transposase RayT